MTGSASESAELSAISRMAMKHGLIFRLFGIAREMKSSCKCATLSFTESSPKETPHFRKPSPPQTVVCEYILGNLPWIFFGFEGSGPTSPSHCTAVLCFHPWLWRTAYCAPSQVNCSIKRLCAWPTAPANSVRQGPAPAILDETLAG